MKYTVVGVWPRTRERYSVYVDAASARQAEDLVQLDAKDNNRELWIVAVFEGEEINMDAYATYVDPDQTKLVDFGTTCPYDCDNCR